ncbi:MAG: L-threonylcarbamoyladenylate synthase [bacterium]
MLTIGYPFQDQEIEVIRDLLINHGTMVFPTETFYALGCLARSSEAVEKIYSLKQRAREAPLLVLIDSWEMLERYADDLTPVKKTILKQYWPGALTAVLKRKGDLAAALNHPDETLGFRMTSSSIARQLVGIVDTPLVGTSANISAGESVACFEQTHRIFGDRVDLYIDGGDTPGGLPSTVVDMTDEKHVRVLRDGSTMFKPIIS